MLLPNLGLFITVRFLTPLCPQNPIFMAYLMDLPTIIPPNPNQTPILALF